MSMAASFFWTAHLPVMYNGHADGEEEPSMKKSFKILLPLLALVLLAVFVLRPSPPPTVQQEPMSKQSIVQELINAYSQGGESDQLDDLLLQLSELDSSEAEKWRQILEYWKVTEKKMDIRLEQLPQGMNAGNGLCLIVLGYQLNPDGSMKEELIGRLETALSAADRRAEAMPSMRLR